MRMTKPFLQIHIFQGDDKDIFFSKTCTLKSDFKSLHFQASKNVFGLRMNGQNTYNVCSFFKLKTVSGVYLYTSFYLSTSGIVEEVAVISLHGHSGTSLYSSK